MADGGIGRTSRSKLALRLHAGVGLVAVVSWVFAAELLPGAHLALHASLAPHTHSAEGTFAIGDERPSRCHDDGQGVHCHGGRAPATGGWDRPADAHDSARPRDPAHGVGSLSHHALAFQRPAPALAPLAAAPFVDLCRAVSPAPLRAHVVPRAPQMRGPPA